jgi:hypothetical protein
VIVAAVGGCGSGGVSPDATPPAPVVNPPGSPSASPSVSPGASSNTAPRTPPRPTPTAPQASPVASAAKGVIAPKDAKYTIVCATFGGPAHVQQARVSKDNLITSTGRREFYVVHDEAQSTLYYGYYRERERSVDATEAARANKDMDYVRSLATSEGQFLFSKSLLVPLPMPDPVAPPEFDITRLDAERPADDPNRAYWSLAIADYTGDVQIEGKGRKQLAVESVIEARRQGHQAFYYNGPNTSTVCIGAWPRRAVREQEANSARSSGDNGQEIIVSNAPIPKALTDRIAASGRDPKVLQPKVEIDDPTLDEMMMKRYPDYYLNGVPEVNKYTDPRTGEVKRRPKQSFLFEIPRVQREGLLAGDRAAPAGGETAASATDPTPGAPALSPTAVPGGTSGGGRLRSVTP